MFYEIEKAAVAEKQNHGHTHGIQRMIAEYEKQNVYNQLCQSVARRYIQVWYLTLVAKGFV